MGKMRQPNEFGEPYTAADLPCAAPAVAHAHARGRNARRTDVEAEAPPPISRHLLLADYASVVHSDDPNQMAQASSHPLTMIALPQTLVPATTPRSPSLHRPTALTLTAMVTVKVTSSPATQGRC